MRKLKGLAALILSGAMVLSLAACGATPAANTETTKAQEETADETKGEENAAEKYITWSTYASTDSAMKALKELGEEPCLATTGIKLEYKQYADRQTLPIEVAGGSGPDIMDLDGPTDVIEFINAEKVVDLTPYVEKYGWDTQFMTWAIESCKYNGVLYSLPTCYEGMGMYYNMDVMNEHGWTIPETIDELEALYDEILAAGLVPVSFGNSNYQGAVDWLYSTFLSCYIGGIDNMKSVLQGEMSLYENEGVRTGMERLASWYTKGYIDNNSTGVTTDDMIARFANGDAVTMIDGTWGSNSLIQDYPECNWQFELMPAENAGEDAIFPIAVGGSACINANTADVDAAAEVLNWHFFNNQDSMYINVTQNGGQPYPVLWFDADKLEGMDEKLVHMYDVMNTALKDNHIGYCSWTFYPADARVFMNENTDSVFLGVMSVEDYLNGAQEFIDIAIENGTSPQLP